MLSYSMCLLALC